MFDAGIELIPPSLSESRPVLLTRRPLLRQSIECLTDVSEGDPHRLRSTDEGEPTQRVPSEAALVPCVSIREDQALTLVEVEGGDRESTSLGDLTNRPGTEEFVTGDHLLMVPLDLNNG